jgi:DNA invertase Pin-like site-specific DNA recombinase
MQGTPSPPAVVYAANSTADERGSIPAQLRDARELAEHEGMEVVAEYSDEAASAFKGNRGPDLERAMEHAERLGCALVVQHSDRLARGDGKRARHLVEYALWALKADVTLVSVQDPQTFGDLLYAVVTGQRNADDSQRKSTATRDGLRRRAERGDPVGAIPDGYRHEPKVENGRVLFDQRGNVVTERIVDEPRMAAIALRAFDLVEAGHTFGDVARRLNAEGLRTRRGKNWTTRAVRRIILNEDYTGSTGYPRVVEPERWREIVDGVTRLDPVAVQARKGGRRPAEDYLLRGVAHCARCGSSMYTRRFAGGRHYVCGAVREARGTCDLPRVPAAVVERYVVDHLHHFRLDVGAWLAERESEGAAERAVLERESGRLRRELATAQSRVAKTDAQQAGALDADDREGAATALRLLARYEARRDALAALLGDAEARVEEFATEPSLDATLDRYNAIADFIDGRLAAAEGVAELNAALRSLLERTTFDREGDLVLVEFRLRGGGELAVVAPEDGASGRLGFFDLEAGRHLGRSEPQTFVYRPVSIPALELAV